MRNAQSTGRGGRAAALRLAFLAAGVLLAACGAPPAAPAPGPSLAPSTAAALPPATLTPTPGPLVVTLIAEGQARRFALPQPLTVGELLSQAGVTLGEFDRLDPPPFTRLTDGVEIRLVRVRQTFEVEQVVTPFETQILRNENLPADSAPLILQPGVNGQEEVTYRVVFEDGVQVSRSAIRRVQLQAPIPQITMIGVQKPFTAAPITGTLAYLSGGDAWVMRGNSNQLTRLTASGDLDGRVFDLAPDGRWLLVSRTVTESATTFNTLAAISLTAASPVTAPVSVSLPVTNTLYAEWSPLEAVTLTLAYSTADKTTGALGWQARNDLWLLNWSQDPRTRRPVFTADEILPASFKNAYAWWGTGYAFAPDGARLGYAQADSVGVVDLATREQIELMRFTPYSLQSDTRAWYPGLRWAEGGWLYTLVHGPPLDQFEQPEFSTVFNLVALAPDSRLQLELVPRAGMFANPAPSPAGSAPNGERPARVAFLLATDPKNPLLTPYRLAVMDRDGSNLRLIFPPEAEPGIEPGVTPAWSPDGRLLVLIYEGNLWLIDPDSGETIQLTVDELTTRVEWGR